MRKTPVVERCGLRTLMLLLLLARPGLAQDWAQKMFQTKAHNFGTVARGSRAVYRFQVKNLYEETVHIAGVRSSCGCTAPEVVRPTIETFETAEIVATFNTVKFQGRHSATLTVVIDRPFPAEVQLQVYGNVRSDVVFQPGSVRLGSVEQGTSNAEKIRVIYAGNADWRIVDVRCAHAYYEVQASETQRGPRQVTYELLVRLKDDAPVGYLNDQLVLVTNDRNATRIPLQVEGRVVPEITVSPQPLVLGDVLLGKTVHKKLVVRAKRPFRILGVSCNNASFSFQASDEPKTLHMVDVSFQPQGAAGKIEETIRIKTDRPAADVLLTTFATVIPAGDRP